MKQINTKKLRWIIPVLAVLVIFESVVIVQKLVNQEEGVVNQLKDKVVGQPQVLKKKEMVTVELLGDQSLTLGEEAEVTVEMIPLENTNLDAVDVYVEYDPAKVEIVGVTPTDRFSYLAKNWIEPDKNRVLVTMVETELADGVAFSAGEQVKLMTLKIKPLTLGELNLKLVKASENKGKGTLLALTGEEVPFLVNNFQAVVTK